MEYMALTLEHNNTDSVEIRLKELPSEKNAGGFNSEQEFQDFVDRENLTLVHEDAPDNLRSQEVFATIPRRRLYRRDEV